MPLPKLVDIRRASIWRGETCVFENLSLAIEQQERVAILGPNGCGKSTLLKAINCELYPVVNADSHMKILGRDGWDVWELRRRIGTVSSELQEQYDSAITAIEVVVSGFFSSIGVHGTLADRVTREQVDAARQALRDVNMDELRRKPLRRLSTGQRRRILLARALVHDPHTLILDEPTSGLDFAASFDYLKRIRQLAHAGRNVIIVTHNLNEIPPQVERIIVLKCGKVLADGKKSEVLRPEVLSDAYETPIRIAAVDDYYLAYPGEA